MGYIPVQSSHHNPIFPGQRTHICNLFHHQNLVHVDQGPVLFECDLQWENIGLITTVICIDTWQKYNI